jgi:hypothetical protein
MLAGCKRVARDIGEGLVNTKIGRVLEEAVGLLSAGSASSPERKDYHR